MADTPTPPSDFQWQLDGRITVIDHGATFCARDKFAEFMATEAFSVVAFDPANLLGDKPELDSLDEFQRIAHLILGSGEATTFKACLDPALSGTLEPLAAPELSGKARHGAQVLTRLPIDTVTLDSIDGLPNIDWLILDAVNPGLAILEHGLGKLAQTLLVHVRIPFMPTHQQQAGWVDTCQWMSAHGFQCYRLNEVGLHSHLPDDMELEKAQSTQFASAEAVFIPDRARLQVMNTRQSSRLAFLLDTVHGIHDLPWQLLNRVDPDNARRYLISHGYLSGYHDEADTFALTFADSPAPWLSVDQDTDTDTCAESSTRTAPAGAAS